MFNVFNLVCICGIKLVMYIVIIVLKVFFFKCVYSRDCCLLVIVEILMLNCLVNLVMMVLVGDFGLFIVILYGNDGSDSVCVYICFISFVIWLLFGDSVIN